MKLRETILLIISTILTSVAALFALIGLTTPKWSRTGYGLWNCNDNCPTSSATFSIIALFLLVASVILLIILILRLLPQKFRLLPIGLIFIATLFLLISTATYLRYYSLVGYSFELMITAHAFAFITSILLAFWFGTTIHDKPITNPIPPTTMRSSVTIPTVIIPPSRHS